MLAYFATKGLCLACEGAHNIADDIFVDGKSVEEHDKRLVKVLEKLAERSSLP